MGLETPINTLEVDDSVDNIDVICAPCDSIFKSEQSQNTDVST